MPRVAVSWSSFSGFNLDSARSIPFDIFCSIFDGVDVEVICAQQAIKPYDEKAVREFGRLRFFGSELTDFEETAALLRSCDLVIASCSSIAHLGGSLRLPVWVVLGRNSDWRWFLCKDDSPWYPTARLFRRSPEEDTWHSLVPRLRNALLETFKY
jgi:hypothetical protein